MAVLVDATVIRAVLLPATMKLLGDWNWYLPKWLEWLPDFSPYHGPEYRLGPHCGTPRPQGLPGQDRRIQKQEDQPRNPDPTASHRGTGHYRRGRKEEPSFRQFTHSLKDFLEDYDIGDFSDETKTIAYDALAGRLPDPNIT